MILRCFEGLNRLSVLFYIYQLLPMYTIEFQGDYDPIDLRDLIGKEKDCIILIGNKNFLVKIKHLPNVVPEPKVTIQPIPITESFVMPDLNSISNTMSIPSIPSRQSTSLLRTFFTDNIDENPTRKSHTSPIPITQSSIGKNTKQKSPVLRGSTTVVYGKGVFHEWMNSSVKISCIFKGAPYSIYPKKNNERVPVIEFSNSTILLEVNIFNPKIVSWSARLTFLSDKKNTSISSPHCHDVCEEINNNRETIIISSKTFENPFLRIHKGRLNFVDNSQLDLIFYDEKKNKIVNQLIEVNVKGHSFLRKIEQYYNSEYSTIYI